MGKNILLCGVGGQGTVLASKLIATAAMDKGIPVMGAETIGMAQRGGSVFSHLKFGDGIYSPMIPMKSADIIIGFEPGETVRMLPFLKDGGTVVVNTTAVMPVTASISDSKYSGEEMLSYLSKHVENLIAVDAEKACKDIGSPMVTNMVLLGAAVRSNAIGLTIEDIKSALQKKVKPQFHELNYKALDYYKGE